MLICTSYCTSTQTKSHSIRLLSPSNGDSHDSVSDPEQAQDNRIRAHARGWQEYNTRRKLLKESSHIVVGVVIMQQGGQIAYDVATGTHDITNPTTGPLSTVLTIPCIAVDGIHTCKAPGSGAGPGNSGRTFQPLGW